MAKDTSTISPKILKACFNSFPECTIELVQEIRAGKSGAYVATVNADFPSNIAKSGPYIIKIDELRAIEKEIQAASQARSIIGSQVPNISEPSNPHKGFCGILISVTHDNILQIRDLAKTLVSKPWSQGPADAGKIAQQILEWHQRSRGTESPLPVSDDPSAVQNVIRTAAFDMHRKTLNRSDIHRVSGSDSVGTRLKAALGIDEQTSRLEVAWNVIKPNPLAYLKRQELWISGNGEQQYHFPLAPSHGDLHAENVICFVGGGTYEPVGIDWTFFEPRILEYFDIAYLELDIILRGLNPVESRSAASDGLKRVDWATLFERLTDAKIKLDLITPYTESPFQTREAEETNNYLVLLRQNLEQDCGSALKQRRAWWMSCVAAGLNHARKSNTSNLRRAISLMYSAYALESLLTVLDVNPPTNETPIGLVWSNYYGETNATY